MFSVVDSGLVWGDPALDLTPDIIERFDAAAPARPAPPLPLRRRDRRPGRPGRARTEAGAPPPRRRGR